MNWKKLIGGRQFWSLLAVLAILFGVLLMMDRPQETMTEEPMASSEDEVKILVLNYHMVNTSLFHSRLNRVILIYK